MYQDIGIGSMVIDSLAFKEISIDFDVLPPFRGDSRFLENSCHRAGRLAGPAVNALVRVNEKLLALIKTGFTLCRMNAVYGTDIDTGSIFRTHTRLGDDIRHSSDILLLARHVRERQLIPGT
jgi:hypothetical protein